MKFSLFIIKRKNYFIFRRISTAYIDKNDLPKKKLKCVCSFYAFSLVDFDIPPKAKHIKVSGNLLVKQ